jgi:hypothetical protein
MDSIKMLLARMTSRNDGRFNQYYGDLVGGGVGYPTADEVRKDMIRHYESVGRFNWTMR